MRSARSRAHACRHAPAWVLLFALVVAAGCGSGAPTPSPSGIVFRPGTPTSVPSPIETPAAIDLTGLWDDSGRQVRITQVGTAVTATYVETYVCDHRDGTGGTSETDLDFTATLEGRTLSGEINTCNFGSDNPHGVGIQPAPFSVTVSPDGQQMTGSWYSQLQTDDIPLTITRLE